MRALAQQTLLGLKEQFEEKAEYFCCCCLLPFIISNLLCRLPLGLLVFWLFLFYFILFPHAGPFCSSSSQKVAVARAASHCERVAPPAEVCQDMV